MIVAPERRYHDIRFKRLEAGTFQQLGPSVPAARSSGEAGIELSTTDLTLLLTGVDLASAHGANVMLAPADPVAGNS